MDTEKERKMTEKTWEELVQELESIIQEQEPLRIFLNQPGNYYGGDTDQAKQMRKLIQQRDQVESSLANINACWELQLAGKGTNND